jgi:polygalacturonase
MATMAVRAVAAAMAALAVAVAPHDGAPIDVAALPEFLAARSRHAAGAPNDTLVLQAAIDKAAMGAGGGVVLLREGQTFVSWPLQLRSNIKLVIDGTLATNGDPHHEWVPQGGHHQSKVALLWATSVRNLTVTSSRHGLGRIDGNGSAWWPLRRKSYTFWAPEMFSCVDCSGVRLTNFNVTDSPAWCLENSGAVDFLAENLTITAPHDSPNTDGIGIDCTGSPDEPCIVRNCVISNGDDEVAVGGSNVLVEDSHFSNGHGASIGSLGYNGSSAHVSNITFRNLVFNHTATTMRIKTWQGGHGLVKNVTYENITVHDVGMPIRLTQFYCPGSQHKGQCPNLTAGEKTPLCAPFIYKNEHFAKTGSGQT